MEDFSRQLGEKLGDIYRNVILLEEHALKVGRIPLTVSEIHLVNLLNKHRQGITVGHIAELMVVSRPTATVAVNRIVSKGYALKKAGEKDGRRVLVCLTPEGKRIGLLHKRCQQKVIGQLGNEFSPQQQALLLRAIDKLSLYFSDVKGLKDEV